MKITFRYFLVIVGVVFFTWIIHEFSHWLMGELLGYKGSMSLNGTSFDASENPTEWHRIIVSAAGPIVTILQGWIAFLFLRNRGWNKYVYPFLFTAFYMRLLAGLMNFIMLNDEGRISVFLGIGTFTLSIIVSGLLFFMVYKISKRYQLNWKFQLGTVLMVLLVSSILIMADQYFRIQIL